MLKNHRENDTVATSTPDLQTLKAQIIQWGQALGFQQIGISDIDLSTAEQRLQTWLAQHWHGDMHFMQKHGSVRSHPEQLLPGTVRVICARMNYLPKDPNMHETLADPRQAYIARYALGRDYHKLMRKRLQRLSEQIQTAIGNFGYRAFVDSAPVLEKPLAVKAGLGWMGKHTNLINRSAGSWFFLGEIYTDLPLAIDQAVANHCGNCQACISACPTDAIRAPYQLDARRCISYLTIELRGTIPEELRPLIGNRVFGCDDCQLVCPWNRFAKFTDETDFHPRHRLDTATLLELFAWSKDDFLDKTQGSAIRRIGYNGWLRNLAVALGNAPYDVNIIAALQHRLQNAVPLVQEHVTWALQQQSNKRLSV